MKIAYLITAYDQPRLLHRMVRALDCDEVSFYIHIDNNVPLSTFEPQNLEKKNVRFLRNRIAVQWMGFSQVESILLLMRHAIREGFDYCVLLSGSDYPIKSNNDLKTFFASSSKEFIVFWRLADRPSWRHKIEYLYPIDLIPIYSHSKGIEENYWRRFFWGLVFKYQRYMPKRRYFKDITPYGGSDWWSLSYKCVTYILQFVERNPSFVQFYRYTHCPSEMFFQTIILNSKFADQVQNFNSYMEWAEKTSKAEKLKETSMLAEDSFNLRYIDWSLDRERPSILDDRDWDEIKNSPNLFARKFHPIRSATLLDRIDRELLGQLRT